MAEELFEVWVDGVPLGDKERGLVFRFPEWEARRRVDRWEKKGRRAVIVPDQSKRPPTEELLRGV